VTDKSKHSKAVHGWRAAASTYIKIKVDANGVVQTN